MTTDIRLINNASADTDTSIPILVGSKGGVNVYSRFTSLGGGTLNIYECPNKDLKPNQAVYTSATGEAKHLNVSKGSYLVGELTGSTAASNVTLGVVTLGEDE